MRSVGSTPTVTESLQHRVASTHGTTAQRSQAEFSIGATNLMVSWPS